MTHSARLKQSASLLLRMVYSELYLTLFRSKKRARTASSDNDSGFKRAKKTTFKKSLSLGDKIVCTEGESDCFLLVAHLVPVSSMYYFNDNEKASGKASLFLLENQVLPAVSCDEAATPITVEDACVLASNFKTLVVTAKDGSGKIAYTGSPNDLDTITLKQFLSTEQTFNLRTPSLALFDQSVLLVGWSREAWTNYGVWRMSPYEAPK